MNKKPSRPPYGLAITAIVLLVIGFVFSPIMRSVNPEAAETNIFVLAVPFLAIFIAILLLFIFSIFLLARRLNGRIPERVYRPVEAIIIAGIVLGIIGMFQPFAFAIYRYSFTLLLISTFAFIVWSHIVPKRVRQDEGPAVPLPQDLSPAPEVGQHTS
jgi:hypothetical protein